MHNLDTDTIPETPAKRHDPLRKSGQYILYVSIALMLATGSMSFSMMVNMPAEGNMRLFGMVSFLSSVIIYPVAGYAIQY